MTDSSEGDAAPVQPRTPRKKRRTWRTMGRIERVLAIFASLFVIGGGVGGLLTWMQQPSANTPQPSASTGTGGIPSQEVGSSAPSPGESVDEASRCRDVEQRPVRCESDAEWIILQTTDCSEEGAARSLGVGSD